MPSPVYVEEPLPLLGEKHAPKQTPNPKDPKDAAQDKTESNLVADPHNLMLLYDLFFAANLTAFSNIHETTTGGRLVAYVGYFLVLWLLWLNVMLFDVRFVIDSVAERVLRAIQLGAMVGVSVVAPQYNPADQIRTTFQAFSVILMVTRLVLAVQYGLATLRQPREARTGLFVMSGAHFVAAMVYLGITFRFTDSKNSRVFVAWYVIGFVETVVIFAVSFLFKGLSFRKSVLPERTKTATLLILGEGVIVVAEHVSTVVKNANSWTPNTVGVLAATVALIYIIFQIYFDWAWPAARFMSSEPWMYVWSLAHLPFHICLVLIMEGATQFVVWWKIVEMIEYVSVEFYAAYEAAMVDRGERIAHRLVERVNGTIEEIWTHYPPDLYVTHYHKEELLREMLGIDDSHWETFPSLEELDGGILTDERWANFVDRFRAVKVTVLNSILKSFNIEEIEDDGWRDHPSTYQQHAYEDAANRFNLVYIYVFCLAGAGLVVMSFLHIISRFDTRKTWMQRVTIGCNMTLGIGLMLLASMSRFDAHTKFAMTHWIVPSLCLVYLAALALVHLARWIAREDDTSGRTPVQQVNESAVIDPAATNGGAIAKPPTVVATVEEQERPPV
ncbi:hypothetical protein OQA88_3065 [Cercophora sp. LCS_1]